MELWCEQRRCRCGIRMAPSSARVWRALLALQDLSWIRSRRCTSDPKGTLTPEMRIWFSRRFPFHMVTAGPTSSRRRCYYFNRPPLRRESCGQPWTENPQKSPRHRSTFRLWASRAPSKMRRSPCSFMASSAATAFLWEPLQSRACMPSPSTRVSGAPLGFASLACAGFRQEQTGRRNMLSSIAPSAPRCTFSRVKATLQTPETMTR
mmetsp:Transcript_5319/g.18494  ORF Transcript_5319/g.18494 Transcript_5319/m.18494 type:complete len:207 (-) Transcript_5319:1319-1939(-)